MENQKTIGDRIFSFGIIPPTQSVRVQIAIAKVIGEPLFKAFMDHKKTGESADSAETAGMAAIGLMLSKMDPEELLETMKTVLSYVNCDGKRIDIDATFVGKNKELWQVFIAALRFNFSDFLPESLFASIRQKIQA